MGLGTMRWVETEEWIRMDLAFSIGKEPLELPGAEFVLFAHKFLRRAKTLRKIKYSRPIFSLPDMRFWYFIYLNLCDAQSLALTKLDESNVLPWLGEQVACHPYVLQQMKDVNCRSGRWSVEKWVYHTRGPDVTIQYAHKSVANGIWWDDYMSNPAFARKQCNAILWNGDNFDSICKYFDNSLYMMRQGDILTITGHNGKELEIPKENWIWEKDGEIKTGTHNDIIRERTATGNPGIWYEPTERPEWLIEQEEERRAV